MRHPSLRAAGANHRSSERRSPTSAPTRLTSTISGELVERRLGIGDRRDDVLRHHHVERRIREVQVLRVHHPKSLHVGKSKLHDSFLRLAQHGLRDVDAANAVRGRIVGQRDAGADADLEDAAADALGGRDRGVAPVLENRADPTKFRDIKETVDIAVPEVGSHKWIVWTAAGVGAVVVLAMATLAIVRRKRGPTPAEWALASISGPALTATSTTLCAPAVASVLRRRGLRNEIPPTPIASPSIVSVSDCLA